MTTFSLLSGMLDRNSTDNPTIIEERCLRRRLNTNECQLCMTACPHGALTLRGRAVHLDPGLCTGCHRCRAVCPQDACTSDFDLRQTIDNLTAEHGETIVTCSRQPQRDEHEVVLPCLGIISPAALLAIGARSGQTVTFRTDGCGSCINAAAAKAFLAVLKETAGMIKQYFATTCRAVDEKSFQPDRASVSRRAFLRNLKASLRPSPECTLTDQQPASPSGRRTPEKVAFCQNGLTLLDGSMKQAFQAAWLPRLSITSACTRCPRCAGICPTGALKRAGKGGKAVQLLFSAARCSRCRLCVEFCKESAITLTAPN
jgi:ferredoxin